MMALSGSLRARERWDTLRSRFRSIRDWAVAPVTVQAAIQDAGTTDEGNVTEILYKPWNSFNPAEKDEFVCGLPPIIYKINQFDF